MVAAKLDQSRVLVTKFHQIWSTLKVEVPVRDTQTDTQAGWFLRPNCAPRSECPQFGMPAECRAQFRVPNMPRSRISERAPFRIYEHAQCRVFECTSLQRAYVIPCQQQIRSSAVLRTRRSTLLLGAWMGVASILALWR